MLDFSIQKFRKNNPMSVIYQFASEAPSRLLAFAGDRDGSRLPKRHGPWKPTGAIHSSQVIPHRLDRAAIEQAIDEHGFQMWRIKEEG